MSVIEKMAETDKFTDAEKNVIQYILNNPQDIISLRINDLARNANTSPSVITRLCYKCGTKGYSDFKVQLAQEITSVYTSRKHISQNSPIIQTESMRAISEQLHTLEIQTIDGFFNNLDYTKILNAAKLIDQSELVIMRGRGESLMTLRNFQSALARIEKRAYCEMTVGFDSVYPANGDDKACALVMSQRLRDSRLMKEIRQFQDLNIPVILIHASPEKMITKQVEISIAYEVYEDDSKFYSAASTLIKESIMNLLYSFVFSLHYEDNVAKVKKHKEIANSQIA